MYIIEKILELGKTINWSFMFNEICAVLTVDVEIGDKRSFLIKLHLSFLYERQQTAVSYASSFKQRP